MEALNGRAPSRSREYDLHEAPYHGDATDPATEVRIDFVLTGPP